MNTKQIDYCLELAKTLNFSRAAENMYVSQPTFSYQLKLLEEEVNFKIFERSGKGASLTPAGEQFVSHLRKMREELNIAIEQCQNFSVKHKTSITIGVITRQALSFLPEAIKIMANLHKNVYIIPIFQQNLNTELFLNNEIDILFTLEDDVKQISDINVFNLFTSNTYLIANSNDILASKDIITEKDLHNRTLMIGGGSPYNLRLLQNKLIQNKKISYITSANHETTLTNILADRGVCLAPGFLYDNIQEFSWIPFDSNTSFNCVLCTHKNDQRKELYDFIQILIDLYSNISEKKDII